MAVANYGTTNPNAIDPFPIETTLAQMAYGGDRAQAQTALGLYQLKNAVSQDNYDYDLAQQHEFAKQQLAQQLYEANLKGLAEAKDPTVLQLMANSPQYRGNVMGGIPDATLADLITRGRQTQDVTNLEHAGQGVNAISQAGFDPSQAAAGVGITNLGPYAGPALVQAAKIRAAATLGAAKMQAQGEGGDRFSTTGPPDPTAGGASQHVSFGKGTSFQQAQDRGRRYFGGTSLAPNPQGGGGTAPPLPVAPRDEGGGSGQTTTAPPASAPAPASTPGNKGVMDQVRSQIEQNRGKLPPKVYDDLKAGMDANGGNPIIKKGQDGKFHLYGASGNPYS